MSRHALLPAFLSLLATPAAVAQTPPCLPCGGVRTADPGRVVERLAEAPPLAEEARLYVAWDVDLAGPPPSGESASRLTAAGATPWQRLLFTAPSPLVEHAGELARVLAAAAEIAGREGAGDHFQVVWDPPSPPAAWTAGEWAAEYAFLLKRAAVAVTGARSGARVIAGPVEADPLRLRRLYEQDVAAYVDGVAFAPAAEGELEAAIASLVELDPGRPAVVDGEPWPSPAARALSRAAELAGLGVAVTLFETPGDSADLRPLALLANEFRGELSLDPYSRPEGARAWSFVRGEDLTLRVVVESGAGEEVRLLFPDPMLRRPQRVDPLSGEVSDLFGARRTETGFELPFASPDAASVLRIDRVTATELEGVEGLEEEVTITSDRQVEVAEILRRLQAFEDAQSRRLETYRATNTTHLRFQAGTGAQSFEATFRGPFFHRRGEGFDWVWQEFLVNGVRWRGKTIPEIPLVQPEKAAALPVDITFTKQYRYRLRGTETLRGRDCWVIDFEPAVAVEPGATLYRGTVWIDREIHARVRTRAIQLGLEGEVISNEETTDYSPVDASGAPAAWSDDGYVLPLHIVGQQIWSVLSATTVVEREVLLEELEINGDDFDRRLAAALESDATMLRDTERGLRYLVFDEERGERVVQEELDPKRRFLVGGIFFDEAQDFPIPLAGMNWLWLDWRDTGTQVNVFFAGALTNVAITDPDFLGSRFDVGLDAFALAIAGTDTLFRDGREAEEEDVEFRRPNIDFKIGRPFGSFFKLDLQYELAFLDFSRADDTADEFVIPDDQLQHSFRLRGRYNRAGYRLRLLGTYSIRDDWQPWGLPGNDDFDPAFEEYTRWQAGLGKVFHLADFRKVGLELEYVDGSDLDRFSKYEFGPFSDIRVHGYQSDKVRAERAWAAHLSYGAEIAELLRLELVGDVAWATDEASGLEQELLAGVGLVGTLVGPWQTLLNLDVGVAVAGPDDGVGALVTVLKLFR